MQHFVQQYGYWALFLLSILESMCIPIPSEVTFGFAGALTAAGFATHHPLNIYAVIAVGVVGSLVGSVIAYEVFRSAGRTIVDRWGKYVLLTHTDLDKAEAWFAKYGIWSVLVGRVIPVLRTVISAPAGLAEMNRAKFAAMTTVGCAGWVTLLALLGRSAGNNWKHVSHAFHVIQYPVIAVIVVALAFGLWHRIKAVRAHHAQ
jgi:membrane protein DedA with SNARE-associated domain